MLPTRKVTLILSLAAQGSLLAVVAYLDCGWTGPIDGLPECRPWMLGPLLMALPAIFGVIAFPAMYFVPQFFPPDVPFLSSVVREWTWLVVIAGANVILWTVTMECAVAALTRWRSRRPTP